MPVMQQKLVNLEHTKNEVEKLFYADLITFFLSLLFLAASLF